MIRNSIGIAVVLIFLDGTQLLCRVHELSPQHPFSSCLDYLVRQHGRCVNVSLPGDPTPIVPDLSPILAPQLPLFSAESKTDKPKTQAATAA